ncbi:MAG TPA: hypothetical protein VFN10_10520 [Thermoanaerobaculia bacterium]|nr:hypothetical protein [Thermoanaerobaculia bacterium]
MGAALWLAAALVAFAAARLIPRGRRGWLAELVAALVVAIAAGFAATALDFGGWAEPEPRAGLFALLAAFAATGFVRLVTFWRAHALN